ncbi:MAG: ABC transporter substrate-binding protein [Lachnospiraceae bacterium]
MRKQKILALMLSAVIMLCSCGNNGSVSQTVPEQSIYKHKGLDKENADQTLSIYYGTIHNAPMMDAIADDYETATGIRIIWTAADSGAATLKGLFSIGKAPDLFQLERFEIPEWTHYLTDLSQEAWVADVYDDALKAATIGGKLCAWPHTLEASGIVYNKDLFEYAGITRLPETLDELKAVCETLESKGVQSFGESWMEFGYLAHTLASPFNYEENTELISNQILNGEKTFEDLKYIDEFFRLFDLTLEYGLGADSVAYNTMDQYPDFAEGKMAMMKQGTWVERSLKQLNKDMNIGIIPVPLSDNAEENKLSIATTTFLCVNKESQNKQKALDFLEWWHTYAQRYLVNIDGVVPPFYSVDTSTLGMLNREMELYIAEEKTFDGFGYEYWPADFQIDLTQPLQTYAVGMATKAETLQELLRIYTKKL